MELRCDGTMHGRLNAENLTLEVKCKRRKCGVQPGVVVLHTFDLRTGELIETKQFADPRREVKNGSSSLRTAVRPA